MTAAGGALLDALGWIGARARWVLAVGVIVALFLPALSAALRPALPVLVALVLGLAMTRIDLVAVARSAVRPARLLRLAVWLVALLGLAPLAMWAAASVAGLDAALVAALVYTGAAPPITASVGLCLLMGLNAGLALELMVLATVLTPLVGPLVTGALLGAAVPIDAAALGLRVAAMIAAGTVLALLLRRVLGPGTVQRHARTFDGIGAVALLVFVIPLFDGVLEMILARPGFALGVLALVVAANLGVQAVVATGLRRAVPWETAGSAGLVFGNRTVALYLAALPPDPVFALYVGLYQVPMLFTPLVMGRALRGRAAPRR
jgi:predicted Na+-dependent transporter